MLHPHTSMLQNYETPIFQIKEQWVLQIRIYYIIDYTFKRTVTIGAEQRKQRYPLDDRHFEEPVESA
jgi:hypothetical protein